MDWSYCTKSPFFKTLLSWINKNRLKKEQEKTCIYELHCNVHPHFYITGTSFSLPTAKCSLRTTALCLFSKGKFLTNGWVDLKLGIPDTLQLHLARPSSCTKKPASHWEQILARLMNFDELQGVDIPISQKNLHIDRHLSGKALQTQQGLTRLHTPEGVSGAKGSFWGGCCFPSIKNYKDFTRTRGKYRGLCWPVRSSKQIDPLATWPFLHGIEKKAEASCYRGKLTWLKRTALQTGMLNPWLKSNWRNKRSYYERPKHHRNQGQISFALKEVAQLTIAYSFDQAFSYRLVS